MHHVVNSSASPRVLRIHIGSWPSVECFLHLFFSWIPHDDCVLSCSVVSMLLTVTLCDLMDCTLPGSSIHEIFQARILEWVAISSSRGSSQSRDWTCTSCIGWQILYHWATWKDPIMTQQSRYFFFCLRKVEAKEDMTCQDQNFNPGLLDSKTYILNPHVRMLLT